MFKVTSTKNVIPSSIFITDVTTENDARSIAIGGLGRTFKGKHKGQSVALKVFGRDAKEVGALAFLLFIILILLVRVRLEKSKVF
jgi:hypothetical protein